MSPFNPSKMNQPYKNIGGGWISVTKRSKDGDFKGLCKLRVDDGLHINAEGHRSYIEAAENQGDKFL